MYNVNLIKFTDIIGVITEEKMINEDSSNGNGRITLDLQLERLVEILTFSSRRTFNGDELFTT